MSPGGFRFDEFELDPADRQLRRGGETVELSGRYFDALVLLVSEPGRLVTKDRFLEEVWRGVPVTDEALTQCIRTLRRSLGDSATRPRFIETAPKHGYRFIAAVEAAEGAPVAAPLVEPGQSLRQALGLWLAVTAGGGTAGLLGGLFYGFGAAQPGVGAASMLLVMLAVGVLLGLAAGLGVGGGIAAAGFLPGRPGQWAPLGGAVGGLVVGAGVKMLGLDAFSLLIGRSPGEITGGPEGVVLGGAAGFGVWLVSRARPGRGRRTLALAGAAGALAGLAIQLTGGRLLGGSLELLARSFPDARFSLRPLGALFGEAGLGPVSQAVTGTLEGATFVAATVGAAMLAWRRLFGEGR